MYLYRECWEEEKGKEDGFSSDEKEWTKPLGVYMLPVIAVQLCVRGSSCVWGGSSAQVAGGGYSTRMAVAAIFLSPLSQ